MPADLSNPKHWSGGDKLAVAEETASVNEHTLSEYCRTKDFYSEQMEWCQEATVAVQRIGEAGRGGDVGFGDLGGLCDSGAKF